MEKSNKAFEAPNKRPETTVLNPKSSLCFVPTQVLINPKSSPMTKKNEEEKAMTYRAKASIEGTTLANKKKNEGKDSTEDHDCERETMKNWSPSMDGIVKGDIPPYLTYCMKRSSTIDNGSASSNVFLDTMDADDIIGKVLYGSSKSKLPVFQELCREKEVETKCDEEDLSSREKDNETKCNEEEDLCWEKDIETKSFEEGDDDYVIV